MGPLGGQLPNPNLCPAPRGMGIAAIAPTRVGSGDHPSRLADGPSCTSHGSRELRREQRSTPSARCVHGVPGASADHPRGRLLRTLTLFILSTVVLRRKRVLTLMLWTLSLVRSSASAGCFLGCWKRGKAQVSTRAAAGLAARAALGDCLATHASQAIEMARLANSVLGGVDRTQAPPGSWPVSSTRSSSTHGAQRGLRSSCSPNHRPCSTLRGKGMSPRVLLVVPMSLHVATWGAGGGGPASAAPVYWLASFGCRDSCPSGTSPAPEVCPRSSLLQRQEPQHVIGGKMGRKLRRCCVRAEAVGTARGTSRGSEVGSLHGDRTAGVQLVRMLGS